jgi:glycerophosphoryl diester phosphodiesterase
MELTRRQMGMLAGAAALAPMRVGAAARAPLIFFDGGGTAARVTFDRAIAQGADFLVAPVVMSQDGALVAAPDIELSVFTDVAGRPEFATRRIEKTLTEGPVSGWFCDDFSLPELKTLATGSAPKSDRGAAPPTLLSLQEVIDIARAGSVRTARVVGVSPRMVRPAHFAGGDLAMEPALARLIALNGYDSAAASMIVQALEPGALKAFGVLSRARRMQLTPSSGDLAGIRGWAEAVGAAEANLIQGGSKGSMSATGLIEAAHDARLAVYARVRAPIPHEPHDPRERLTALFLAGADGVMCDDVALAVRARRGAMDESRRPSV